MKSRKYLLLSMLTMLAMLFAYGCSDDCSDDFCAGVTCGDNATCNPNTGACECNTGFEGDPVAGCTQATAPITCEADTDCPENATCDTDAGECVCDEGYIQEGEECVEDTTEGCTEDADCPENATCDTDSGECVCDDGYTMEDGVCVEDATDLCADVDCPENATCNAETGECECDEGYVMDGEECIEEPECTEDADCDDGVACNGAETCGDDGACVAGEDQCGDEATCNADADTCECNDDTLVYDPETSSCVACVADADCDDGITCNGTEMCVEGACTAGEDQCGDEATCNPDADTCVCDDGVSYWHEASETCVACLTDLHCDDGQACNGLETCVDNACEAGTPIDCGDNATCSDPDGTCVCDEGYHMDDMSGLCVANCTGDVECDDGLACNGLETCVDGVCTAGEALICEDDNAYCLDPDGVCVCNDGFELVDDVCTPIEETIADFEDLTLDPESSWIGADASGSFSAGSFRLNGIAGSMVFNNSYNGGDWEGFGYANTTDQTTLDSTNLTPASGAGQGGSLTYAVGSYDPEGTTTPTVTFQPDSRAAVEGEIGAGAFGVYVNNTAYVVDVLQNGGGDATAFTEGDWFKMVVNGIDASGQNVGMVEFYLADFRDGATDIVTQWTWLDLSDLLRSNAVRLEVTLESSDMTDTTMNTPGYFAFDTIEQRPYLASFEDLYLPAEESFWNGADYSGGFMAGGNAMFNNNYVDWGGGFTSWDGFSYSNMTDTETPGIGNQFSAIAGMGAQMSEQYAIAGVAATPTITLDEATTLYGMYVTNTTYAYYSLRDGDDFATAFSDGDYFKLTITGWDADGAETASLDFYLADFRDGKSLIVDDWTFVDLMALGEVKSVTFALETTDVGDFGANTPMFFALDSIIK